MSSKLGMPHLAGYEPALGSTLPGEAQPEGADVSHEFMQPACQTAEFMQLITLLSWLIIVGQFSRLVVSKMFKSMKNKLNHPVNQLSSLIVSHNEA